MSNKIDLGELEKAVRVIAPASKYGYLDYILSDSCKIVFDKKMNPFFLDDFKLERGYNCCDINNFLSIALSHYGIGNDLVFGLDSRGIFSDHFYCVGKDDNLVFDATPLYSFTEANHPSPKGTVEYMDFKNYRYCENPITIFCDGDASHLLTFSTGIVMRGGVFYDFWSRENLEDSITQETFHFTLGDSNLTSGEISTDAYKFNPVKYMRRFKENAVPVLYGSISDLEDSGIITRIDVTKRHYMSFSYPSSKMDVNFETIHENYPSLLGNILHKIAYGERFGKNDLIIAKTRARAEVIDDFL